MIPIGNVRAWQETDNWTRFTHDEQFTLLTLWSMARSPLILGGNLPKNDDFTLSLLTNDEVIAVNQNSTNNKQVYNGTNHIAWVADVPGSKDKYVALLTPRPRQVAAAAAVAGDPAEQTPCRRMKRCRPPQRLIRRRLSLRKFQFPSPTSASPVPARCGTFGLTRNLGPVNGEISALVNSHGAVLLRVHPQ